MWMGVVDLGRYWCSCLVRGRGGKRGYGNGGGGGNEPDGEG